MGCVVIKENVMKKRKISDILWEAANERLAKALWGEGETFTCCAAAIAEAGTEDGVMGKDWKRTARTSPVVQFLKKLGCGPGASILFDQFDPHEDDAWPTERQAARYSWLMMAYYIARDVEAGRVTL